LSGRLESQETKGIRKALSGITRSDHLPLIVYVALSSVLLILIVTIQSYRYGIFGTRLLLGWDSSGYVWQAQDVIKNGPLYMTAQWSFPYLYVHLLAFVGYLSGNVIVVERVLPLLFGILLIYANYQVTLKITSSVHVAGFATILTVFSLNFLRILSDLNRNLMALSLATLSFLLVPNLDSKGSFLNRKYLIFMFLLWVISWTHFETYFVLSLSLVLYGFLTKDRKNIVMLIVACTIPVAILFLYLPTYFLGYASTVVFSSSIMTLDDFVLWTGGSWVFSAFFILAAFCLLRRILRRRDRLVLLFFSYFLVIVLLIAVIVFTRVLPVAFALRIMFLLPIPVLSALAVQTLADHFDNVSLDLKAISAKTKHSFKIGLRRLLLFTLVPILVTSSVIVSFQHFDVFLIPYIPLSGYQKLLITSELLRNNNLSQPVVVYYGAPAIWHTSLYRTYFGDELGEHFSYYGSIENLFRLIPSEPILKGNPSLMESERHFSALYYNDLVGNWTGSIPTLYGHQSYITSVQTLMSHPIVIITPELYNEQIPYYVRQFRIGEGIYIIPPNSLLRIGEVVYGPSVLIHRNGVTDWIRSEYLYADPLDSSIIVLRVNASSGYGTYAFSEYPSSWTFVRIEQGDAISAPENDPLRLDATQAIEGNDDADSIDYWSTMQDGILGIDSSSKKEGFSSVSISGTTDLWGNLGVRYNPSGVLDLSIRPTFAVWAKANEKTTFSITLHDLAGNRRTYWNIRAYGSSATVQWKRFVVDLANYTNQTPNFDLSTVDFVDLYVSSTSGKQMSLWVDDLVIDDFPQLETTIYKARVLAGDSVIAYFATKEGTG
jgi:hypothetical protein